LEVFDAGTSQETMLQGASIADHLDAEHEADPLAYSSPVEGTNTDVDSAAAAPSLGVGADLPMSSMRV
jgi:hypothetical protein